MSSNNDFRNEFRRRGLCMGQDFAVEIVGGGTGQAAMKAYIFPGGNLLTEPGLMRGKFTGIKYDIQIADSDRSLTKRLFHGLPVRWLTGEHVLTDHFNNTTNKILSVEVSPEKYSGLLALNLAEIPGHTINCRPGSWVLSGMKNRTSFEFFRNVIRPDLTLLGRKPCLWQSVKGEDVIVIGCPGSPLRSQVLEAGESFIIDVRNLWAWTAMPHRAALTTTRLKAIVFGKEKLFNLKFTGPDEEEIGHGIQAGINQPVGEEINGQPAMRKFTGPGVIVLSNYTIS